MDEEIQQVPAATPDFQTEIARQLAEMLPEIVADGKIDVAALQTILGEDAASRNERFGLFWPDKTQAIRAAQTPTTATLAPDRENSVDWENTQNVVIEGDNLEVLKVLQKHYYGKIKMIYIDPPYNTGGDFVYPDDYSDPIGSYLELTGQSDGEGKLSTNTESDGRFHSNWLNMMYPRLKLARNLLELSGIMFVSIDEREVHHAISVCVELFGQENVLGAMPVIMNLKGNQDKFGFAETHEFVIVCLRNRRAFDFGKLPVDEEKVLTDWQTDDFGLYKIADNLRATGVNAPRSKRPNLWYPIFVTPGGESFYVTDDDRPMNSKDEAVYPINPKGEQLSWYWKKSTFRQNRHNLILKQTSNGWQFYRKQRPEIGQLPTSKPKSVLFSPRYSTSTSTIFLSELMGGKIFDTPKPLPFLTDLLHIANVESSAYVLDFFAGSGTTAHAVMALNAEDGGNRRCISVQLPEPTDEKSEARKAGYSTISEITRERIRRAGKKILEEEASKLAGRDEALDVGFRAYKLVDTNFAKWRADSSLSEGELMDLFAGMGESTDDDARPEALLTEVLLKLGFSLTEQVQRIDVDGLDAFSVADGLLVAYLNEHVKPTLEQLRALVALESERLVILEDAFQGDDELKTNLVQECRSRGVDLWTV